MSPFEKCFIMLCNKRTEAECLARGLFGDMASRIDYYREVKPGDLGFLLNVGTDELIGPFRACSQAQLDIEEEAWFGKFRAQIRVEPIGEIRRLGHGQALLNGIGVALDRIRSGASVPLLPVQSRDTGEALLTAMHAGDPLSP